MLDDGRDSALEKSELLGWILDLIGHTGEDHVELIGQMHGGARRKNGGEALGDLQKKM